MQFSAFIKEEWVYDPQTAGNTIFEGDDRSGASGAAIFSRSNPNYRVRQMARLNPQVGTDSDGIINGTLKNLAGITKRYEYSTSIVNGHISPQARTDTVIDSVELPWNTNGMLLQIGEASVADMHLTSTRLSSSIVKYTVNISANDPLVVGPGFIVPSITADLILTIDATNLAYVTYMLSGKTDLFPCYDFYINDQLLFKPDSAGFSAANLYGPETDIGTRTGVIRP